MQTSAEVELVRKDAEKYLSQEHIAEYHTQTDPDQLLPRAVVSGSGDLQAQTNSCMREMSDLPEEPIPSMHLS